MFDLFRSRAKAVRILLGVLLGLVALSMVITLIPGWGSGGGDRSDQVVAEVGNQAITVREVQQRLQAVLRNQQIPREMAEIYVPQLVEMMINERMMAYEAERLGFRVSQDDLARGLRTLVPVLFQGGQFVGKEAYAAMLAQQNLTIEQFEEATRTQLLASKLEDIVSQGVVVTPDEVQKVYLRRNEKIKLEYVGVTADKVRSQLAITPEDIRKEYAARKDAFRVAEKRSLQMLVVDQAIIAQRIAAPDAELRRAYDANKDQYRTPDRVHVRHILLKTTDKSKEDVAKLQQKAEDILKQVKAGGDFAELAKKSSEDPGSAVKGGDIGWIVRGQTVKNFENTAFSLEPKQISGIISTEYGFHILQTLEKESARVKPFEEVKEQLAQEWKNQRVTDSVQRLADQGHDLLVKNPNGADQIAQQLGIATVKVDKIGPGDPAPEIGVNPDFESAIGGLSKGGVTPVLQAQGNKLVVAVVTDVFPARQAELSEVENQIRSALTAQKLAALVDDTARQLAEKARANGGDLQKAAQSMGLELKTTQEFTREGAADGIGPANALFQAFEAPLGGIVGPIPVQDSRFVCKVRAKTPADLTKLAEQRTALTDEIRTRKARARTDLFQDSLRTSLFKQKKIKIHDNVIARIVDGYRS